MNLVLVRNIAIILVLAAAVAFVPGGGTTSEVIYGVLSTLILVSLVLFVARFYRERQYDLSVLGDRWRALLYGSVAVIVLAMAARPRLRAEGDGGTLIWVGLLAAAAYAIYLVWRHHREYA